MQAKTIDQVIGYLEEIIHEQEKANSTMGYFPTLYHTVTMAVRDGIRHDFFEDGPRMEQLDVIFANRYLKAYSSFRSGEVCSEAWKLAFDEAKDGKLIVLQHLFLGMSAHINLDLGIAASEVAPGDEIKSLAGDFMKINVILGSLVDGTQNDLAKIWPLLKVIDWVGGSLDESLADFSMNIARDRAWKVACDLSAISQPDVRQSYINALDLRVTAFGTKVVDPGILLSMLLWMIRLTERGTVRSKIAHLK